MAYASFTRSNPAAPALMTKRSTAVACAANLDGAMNRAAELENLARMYYMAIAAGRPAILSDEEVMHTVERFKTYGAGVEAPRPPPARKKSAPKKSARGKAKATTRKKLAAPRA